MGLAAAKCGDSIVNVADIHIVMVPTPTGPVPTPQPFPFNGKIQGGCSSNVRINGQQAATMGSTANNQPPHIPASGSFANPPTNKGIIMAGSPTVRINKKPAARATDLCLTCFDMPSTIAQVVVTGKPSVCIG